MNFAIHPTPEQANEAAAGLLATWLSDPAVRNVMVAAGNTPLTVYGLIARRRLLLSHLNIFALDEYVGVPSDEPRNCANLLRRHVIEAWDVPPGQYFTISSDPAEASASIVRHERLIDQEGGLDIIVLGLGQNGHLGFNEPGSDPDSRARVIPLEASSVEANRKWFDNDYAPAAGATVGLKTILGARRVLLVAYGPHKAAAVRAMTRGPIGPDCPASFLRNHPDAWVFLDAAAASMIEGT